MKIKTLLIFTFITIQTASSQTFQQKIQGDVRQGVLTETQVLYIRALRSFAPDRVPELYRDLSGLPLKSATGLLVRIRSRWNEFTPDQQSVLQSFFYRPDLPDSYVSPSGYFKIHYTTAGYHAVSPDDFDFSGVPDYVEEIANSFEYVYSVEIEQLGFNPPNDDNNEDGPEWDVYIQNINHYGYTDYLVDPGDPNRWITYITMDNDYTHTPTKGMNAARVTAAHEFFHMIQFGYYFRNEDIFLMEVGSTWMEDVVYDYVNDYIFYLSYFFNDTNTSFDYSDGWREYGLCIWFHFLEKRCGTRDIVRHVWEQIVYYPAVEALDMALRGMGHTYDEELALFYGWNYMTGSRADTTRFYPEGHNYPMVRIDGSFQFHQDTSFTEGIVPTAARYYQFSENNGNTITLIPTNLNRDDNTPGEFTLSLIRGEGYPLYTYLENNLQTRIIAEDYLRWKCVAVVESPGQETLFIPFNANQLGFSEEDLPASFPNPFMITNHAMTTIPFLLEEPGNIHIMIARSSGYLVKDENQYYESGLQLYYWDGKDDRGESMPSGIYVYIVTSGSKLIRRDKIALIR